MWKKPINPHALLAIAWLLASHESQAVIVAGTHGTGNNNNTQAGLDSFLFNANGPAFPYWDNLIRVTDASGVYLGQNPDTGQGWVLTANHVTPPTSITVGGSAYSVQSGQQIGTSDLKLYQIGGGGSDPALPNLPTIPMASAYAGIGDYTLMFGRGFTTSTSAPFPWGNPGTSDANGMRWGTNRSSGYVMVNGHYHIITTFSDVSDPSVTHYEAQGALGDSGGGLFIYRNGQWELSGIAHFVDSGGSPVDPSEFGDLTGYTDVYSQLSTIQSYIGTPIPEPSTLMLFSVTIGFLWRRRRSPRVEGPINL